MKRIQMFMKKNWKWFICLLALLAFFLLMEDVFRNEVLSMDDAFANFVISIRSAELTLFFKIVTILCNTSFIAAIFIFVFLVVKNIRIKKYLCVNILIVFMTNTLLKIIVSRPRPLGEHLVDAGGFSFPSGHAMMAVGLYGLFIYFAYKYIKEKRQKCILMVSLFIVILLIGMSRIYLGVHYTSDVLAGFMLSLAYLIVYVSIMESRVVKKINNGRRMSKEG